MTYELKEHQLLALRKLSNGKILYGGVGTGKTFVAATYYRQREAPKDVYVITTSRKRDEFDWQNEFYRLNVGPKSGPEAPKRGRAAKAAAGVSGRDRSEAGGSGTELGRDLLRDVPVVGRTGVLQSETRPEERRLEEEADLPAAGEGLSPSGRETQRAVRAGSGTEGLGEADASGSPQSADLAVDRSEVGSGDSGRTPEPIWALTVDSWHNINKYAGVEGAFFIFDEQRLVGSGAWTKAFLRISRRNHWILLSATPGDTWMDYIPVFVANGFYKNRSEFKREHVVYNTFSKFPKVDRYINVGRLVRQRSQLLVEMPYLRHTRRRRVEVPLLYDKDTLDLVLTKRWHVYEDRPLRDVGEMFLVMRKVVNSDPSRLEMVKELWKRHPRLIIFYNYDFELESLRSLKEHYGIKETSASSTTPQATARPGGTLAIPSGPPTRSGKSSRSESRTAAQLAESPGAKTISQQTVPRSASHATGIGSAGTSTITSQRTATSTSNAGGGESWTTKLLSAAIAKSESLRSKAKSSSDTELPGTNLQVSKTPSGANGSEPWKPTKTRSGQMLHGTPSSNRSSRAKEPDDPSESSTVAIAEWNGHKHEPLPTTDRWLYLVQYTAGAEAWNCTTTDAMIMYSLNYSWKVTEQAEGRNDRMNTPFIDLWYYRFTSDSMIDKAIERSLKAKKTFNESSFASLFRD